MLKMILFAAAAVIALMTTANAGGSPYIGQVVRFYGFQDPIGCRNPRIALRVSRFEKWERQIFANELRLLGDRDTTCILLRETNKEEWRIAVIGRNVTAPGTTWVCVESTIDLRTEEQANPKSPSFIQPDCFWINVNKIGRLEPL